MKTLLIDNKWPSHYPSIIDEKNEIEILKKLITQIRNFKLTYGIKNSQIVEMYTEESMERWVKASDRTFYKIEN